MVSIILHRVRQFWRAVRAKVTPEDKLFMQSALKPNELDIFLLLPIHEQKHSLQVARTALQLGEHLTNAEQEVLQKAALLHDVGKHLYQMNPISKSLAVLGDKLFPNLARQLAMRPHSFFHTYYHHPQVGVTIAQQLGLPQRMQQLIALHHTAPTLEEDPLLTILRQADEMN